MRWARKVTTWAHNDFKAVISQHKMILVQNCDMNGGDEYSMKKPFIWISFSLAWWHWTQRRSLHRVWISVASSCCVCRRFQNRHLSVPAPGHCFWAGFHLGSSSLEVLMSADTNGDDNEISAYQILMNSLTCQLQTGAVGGVRLCTDFGSVSCRNITWR